MTEKRTIGKLIEKEVRKQQLSIVEFADRICCKRNNVYNLFTRNNMDIQQLALISKVLGRNFFKELAEDLELANETDESEEDIQSRKAVSQFMEVAPRVLRKLNASPIIVFSVSENGKYEGCPVPDFMLPDYAISFTIGETFQERAKDFYHPRLISIESLQNKEGIAKTAAKYFLLAALILAANTIMLELCVKYLIHNKYISKILIEVLLFFISWAAQKSFVFRKRERKIDE